MGDRARKGGKPPPVDSLERALDQVLDLLGRASHTRQVRALTIEARRLRTIIGNWRSIDPPAEMREEMIAAVIKLAEDAEEVSERSHGTSAKGTDAANEDRRDTPPILRLDSVSATAAVVPGPPPLPGTVHATTSSQRVKQDSLDLPPVLALAATPSTALQSNTTDETKAMLPLLELEMPQDERSASTQNGVSPAAEQSHVVLPRLPSLQIGRVFAPPVQVIDIHEAAGTVTADADKPTPVLPRLPSLQFERSVPHDNEQSASQPVVNQKPVEVLPKLPSLQVAQLSKGPNKPPEQDSSIHLPKLPSLQFERVIAPPDEEDDKEEEDTEVMSSPSFEHEGDSESIEVNVCSLPMPDAPDPRLVMLHDPYSPRADAYRGLRRKLSSSTTTVVAVTSANPSEGKTSCAINLALALRETTRGRILLIDCNIERPGLAKAFKFTPPSCFTQQLKHCHDNMLKTWDVVEFGESSPEKDANQSKPGKSKEGKPITLTGLHLLAIDPQLEHSPLLDAVAFSMGIESLKEMGYEHIVVDCPAVLGTPNMAIIGDVVDAVIMTVVSKKTAQKKLRAAIEQLRPAPIFGLVLLQRGA